MVPSSLLLHGLYSPWNSSGQNTGVGSLFLLQGIFPTQGSNSGFPHCRWILYQLSHKGSPSKFHNVFTDVSTLVQRPRSQTYSEIFRISGVGPGPSYLVSTVGATCRAGQHPRWARWSSPLSPPGPPADAAFHQLHNLPAVQMMTVRLFQGLGKRPFPLGSPINRPVCKKSQKTLLLCNCQDSNSLYF